MKRLIFALLAMMLPVSAQAWDGAGWDIGGSTIGGTLNATNGVVVGESLGPELLTQTCAGWGLSSPVGAWSCSGDTITRTASGSNLTISNTAAVAGTTYKVVVTYATITAGTFAVSAGGVAQATHGTAGTYTEYIIAGGTGAITITAVAASAGTITISTTSAKAVTSTLSPASGPLVLNKTLSSATANEAGVVIATNQTGAAGSKTTLSLVNNGSGTGTEYELEFYKDGAQVGYVRNAGDAYFASNVDTTIVNSNSFKSTLTTPGTTGAFYSTGALNNGVANKVFAYTGKPAANTSNGVLEAYQSLPDLSNNHTAGSSWISYSAPDLVSPDPDIATYGVRIGSTGTSTSGYTYPIIAAPPTSQTIAAGNTVLANGCGTMKQITAAGPVTTDTTNTFSAPGAANAGCCMDVVNVGAQTITLDGNANFLVGGSTSTDVALTAGDSARVCCNGTAWYLISAYLTP